MKRKICNACDRQVSLRPIKDTPTDDDIPEIVSPEDCELCKAKIEQQKKADEDMEQSITDFLLNISHVDRPSEWKAKLIARILGKN